MQAVILAGGYGTRLRPLTKFIPKPLLPLGNSTIIENLINQVLRNNFKKILLALNYKADLIIEYLKERGYKFDYIIEKKPLGTAGCIKNAEKLLEETFLVLSGDNYTKHNFKDLLNFHKKKKADMTLALIKPKNPRDYAIVKINKNNLVLKFKEKPKGKLFSKLTTCGTYIINKKLLKFIPKSKKFDISYDFIPLLLKNNVKIYGKLMKGTWEDIGNFERYKKALNLAK